MITPQEIRKKSEQSYWRYLTARIHEQHADFFPVRLRVNLRPISGDLAATIAAVDALRSGSKQERGRGYTVQWKQVRSRDHGRNLFPQAVVIETLDDLLWVSGKQAEFDRAERVIERVRQDLPQLISWLGRNVKSISNLEKSIEGLIAVAYFFMDNPWPDCYARQIPVAVDTKFVERHEPILRAWLDELLPASAIQADEVSFAHRFGLRDGQQHRTVRILDDGLRDELGFRFDEFSLPMRYLAELSVADVEVFVAENRLNVLTFPELPRAIAIHGEGKAVTRLVRLPWLASCRLVYWGDVDVEGFEILASLRALFPDVVSVMMDVATLDSHAPAVHSGTGRPARPLNVLTEEEQAAYQRCANENMRLEQEQISQVFADAALLSVSRAAPWRAGRTRADAPAANR